MWADPKQTPRPLKRWTNRRTLRPTGIHFLLLILIKTFLKMNSVLAQPLAQQVVLLRSFPVSCMN